LYLYLCFLFVCCQFVLFCQVLPVCFPFLQFLFSSLPCSNLSACPDPASCSVPDWLCLVLWTFASLDLPFCYNTYSENQTIRLLCLHLGHILSHDTPPFHATANYCGHSSRCENSETISDTPPDL
jgi:hypothetical protein